MKHRKTTDTRDAYRARVAAQFGALRNALDSGAGVVEAAAQAGLDPVVAQLWAR